MPELDALTGDHLLATFRDVHPREVTCPGCGEGVGRVGITHLAYRYERCTCVQVNYEHLVERLWHLRCLSTAAPDLEAVELLHSAMGAFRGEQGALGRQLRGFHATQIETYLASRKERDGDHG